MTISTIDSSQRTAAKVAGLSGLFPMAIVVFANYALLSPLIVAVSRARSNADWCRLISSPIMTSFH